MVEILSVDMSGRPFEWLSLEKAAYHYAKDNVAFTLGDENIRLRGGFNNEGDRSILEINSIIAIRGAIVSSGDHVALNNANLFARDRFVCGYCGQKFRKADLNRDHIIPVSKGGQDVWSNVTTSCLRCNSLKGAKTLDELGWKLLYVPYVPCRNEGFILQARAKHILADQMSYLMAGINKNSRLL